MPIRKGVAPLPVGRGAPEHARMLKMQMRSVFLFAVLVLAVGGIGCSDVVPSMSGAPAPNGIAKFGTWLEVVGNRNLSSIIWAEIDSSELRKKPDLVAEVKFRDTWVNAATITKAELLELDSGATEAEVDSLSRDLYNDADTRVSSESCTYYFRGNELVQVQVHDGKIRLNNDPERLVGIGRARSLADVEKLLGPATSKKVAP